MLCACLWAEDAESCQIQQQEASLSSQHGVRSRLTEATKEMLFCLCVWIAPSPSVPMCVCVCVCVYSSIDW